MENEEISMNRRKKERQELLNANFDPIYNKLYDLSVRLHEMVCICSRANRGMGDDLAASMVFAAICIDREIDNILEAKAEQMRARMTHEQLMRIKKVQALTEIKAQNLIFWAPETVKKQDAVIKSLLTYQSLKSIIQ